ncbi:MAG TPA: MerR family transcriptional regulator [Planctomycetota bacterium]|nr:MerR family transcriptional regulator [Planctomycetota bacterium]
MTEAPKQARADASQGQKLLKAGELARRTGLTRQSLHQYVLLGLLEPVGQTRGGQRLFSEEAVSRIKLIHDLLASGYTLRGIKDTFFTQQGR